MPSARFWAGPFSIVLGAIVGGVVAYGWMLFGGVPHDADRHGRVPVPGKAVLTLPEGRVPIDHDDVMVGGGSNRVLEDAPAGLRVTVRPVRGGRALDVESVPSWLFSSSSGDRGHEPFARVDVPRAGRYVVRASADEPSSARLIAGAAPWTPFGSVPAGAVLAFLVVFAIAAGPGLLIARRLPARR
jgi:hypothetical protein